MEGQQRVLPDKGNPNFIQIEAMVTQWIGGWLVRLVLCPALPTDLLLDFGKSLHWVLVLPFSICNKLIMVHSFLCEELKTMDEKSYYFM